MQQSLKAKKSVSAYQRLRQMIDAGEIPIGERLTEARAIVLTGLGRGPVRESLLRLEAEGLLQQRGARRSRVVGIVEEQDRQELLSRYELREQIEAGAARLAAKNMNGWQIERLRRLAERIDEFMAAANDDARFRAAAAFHEYLLSNCGNPLMYQVWQTHRLAPSRPGTSRTEHLIMLQMPEADRDRPSWSDVVDAIAAHDQDRAELLAKQRIQIVTEALRRVAWDEFHPPLEGDDAQQPTTR